MGVLLAFTVYVFALYLRCSSIFINSATSYVQVVDIASVRCRIEALRIGD